jgi:hypothetical protein
MFDGAGLADAVDAATADGGGADSSGSQEGNAHDGTDQDGAKITAPAVASEGESRSTDRKIVVFVEDNVTDYQTLVNAVDRDAEVVILDADEDGLAAMAEWARTHQGYEAIHVISHGGEGSVDLGSITLSSNNLGDRAADLTTLGSALTANGDLLLYGCEVASGTGEAFIQALADATGADVGASDDVTGATDMGGDWDLEATTGAVVFDPVRQDLADSGYENTLAGVDAWDLTINEDRRGELIVLTGGPADGYYKVTGIAHGELFSGVNEEGPYQNGDFIPVTETESAAPAGETWVYFSVDTGWTGTVTMTFEASTTATDAGLTGDSDTSIITVQDSPDLIGGLTNKTFRQNDVRDDFQRLAPNATVATTGGLYYGFAVENITADKDHHWQETIWLDTNGTGVTIKFDYELYVDNVLVGNIGGGVDGGRLVIVLDQDNATASVVQKIARAVIYRNDMDEPPRTQVIEFSAGAVGSPGTQDDQTMTVTITPDNAAPVNVGPVDWTTIDRVETVERVWASDHWMIDRYRPVDFENTVFAGRETIHIKIGNETVDNFYGYKHEFEDFTLVTADLYMDSDWLTNPNAVRPGIWTVAYNDDAIYRYPDAWPGWPLLEYNKDADAFRVWDEAVGYAVLDMPANAAFDTWYTLSIELLDNGRYKASVEGRTTAGGTFTLSYTTVSNTDSTAFRGVLLNSRANNTTDYDVYWSRLEVNTGDARTSSILARATVAEHGTVAIEGLAVADRDDDILTTVLSTTKGTLSVARSGGATITDNGTGTLSIRGTAEQVNAALDGLSFTAAHDAVGTAVITMKTTDTSGLSDTDTIRVSVTFVDDAPTFLSRSTLTGEEGSSFSFDVQATDGDGGKADSGVTYSLVGGTARDAFSINPATGVLTGGSGLAVGSYTLTVAAWDGALTTSQTLTITITAKPAVSTPITPPPAPVVTNNTGSAPPPAAPPASPTLVIPPPAPLVTMLDTGPGPGGLVGDPLGDGLVSPFAPIGGPVGDGRPAGESPAGGGDGGDGQGPAPTSFDAPTLTPGSLFSFTLPAGTFSNALAGSLVDMSATLADGSPLPSWLSFDPTTGSLVGEPPPGLTGELLVRVTGRDGAGNAASVSVRLNVGAGTGAAPNPDGAPPSPPAEDAPPPSGDTPPPDQQGRLLDGDILPWIGNRDSASGPSLAAGKAAFMDTVRAASLPLEARRDTLAAAARALQRVG